MSRNNLTGAERQAKWRDKQNELASEAKRLREHNMVYVIEQRIKKANVNDNAEATTKAIETLLNSIDPKDFADWKRSGFEMSGSGNIFGRADPPKPDARLLKFITKWQAA